MKEEKEALIKMLQAYEDREDSNGSSSTEIDDDNNEDDDGMRNVLTQLLSEFQVLLKKKNMSKETMNNLRINNE